MTGREPRQARRRGGPNTGRIQRRKRLGQHFLTSRHVAEEIVTAADICNTDVVFELGTGHGVLTGLLCQKALRVVSVEIDEHLAADARMRLSGIQNLCMECGDGIAGGRMGQTTSLQDAGEGQDVTTVVSRGFDIFVSNIPYSESRRVLEALACSAIPRCVVMVQREFADKLTATGDAAADRRAVSIIAQYCFEIRTALSVGPECFSPPPAVDSVVLVMIRRNSLDRRLIGAVNTLFSYRRKQLSTAVRQICRDRGAGAGCTDILDSCGHPDTARIDDLTVCDIVYIARRLAGLGVGGEHDGGRGM